MSFTLYTAGSSYDEITDFVREHGCGQLLSQYTERKHILEWVDYIRNHPDCRSKLFVDSGAFTAHTKGITIDVDDYIKFINEIDDCVTVFAQVDTIAGIRGKTVTAQQQQDAPRESWENYLYMVDKVKSPDKLLPVFHQGDDFKWLTNMLEYRHPDGGQIKYIGVSCNKSLNKEQWIDWFKLVFKYIKNSSNPNVCTHAFGVGAPDILEMFPFTSSDSTRWLKSAAYNKVLYKNKILDTGRKNITAPIHLLNQPPDVLNDIKERCKLNGVEFNDLLNFEDNVVPKDTGIAKMKFNLYNNVLFEKNYQYREVKIHNKELF